MILRVGTLFLATTMMTLPELALAGESKFFAGLNTSVGKARGSSGTKNGGGFGGGGVVKDVKFGTTTGIGGHLGYKFNREVSGYVSYHYTRGDIDWSADFSGQTTDFSGSARSHAVLLNIAYDWFVSDKTAIKASAGVGTAFNKLSSITETYQSTFFVADLKNHTKASPAAQLGASIQRHISPNTAVGLNATIAYTGSFRTGGSRTGNLGVTEINPYKIDDVWQATLGASLQVRF